MKNFPQKMVSASAGHGQVDCAFARGFSRACVCRSLSARCACYRRRLEHPLSRVIRVLYRLVSARGVPRVIRGDNGTEFVSFAVLGWLARERIDTAFIAPVKPWQNALDESFIGKRRDERLSIEWFRNRREAVILIEA